MGINTKRKKCEVIYSQQKPIFLSLEGKLDMRLAFFNGGKKKKKLHIQMQKMKK